MSASPDEHARRWADDLELQVSAEVLEMGRRRVCTWGRLAQFPELVRLAGVVRVDVLEHGGGPPHMAQGTAHAKVWVEARSDAGAQRLARDVFAAVEQSAWAVEVLLTVEVHRARRRDWLVRLWRWRTWDPSPVD